MRKALIVSHGQPSDPDNAEAALADLARQVAAHLPGWTVASATLAKPGALAAAVTSGDAGQAGVGRAEAGQAEAGQAGVAKAEAVLTEATQVGVGKAEAKLAGVVYPLFMAGGWFPLTELPRRMALAGAAGWHHLPPFGLDAAVQALAVQVAVEAAAAEGWAPDQTAILLAAHGSSRSAAPSEVAHALAARLTATGFARAEAFFIDQAPQIANATGFGPRSLCLPFFAAEGGHVLDDLPGALALAGFGGRLLAPLGLDARVPALIAAAIRNHG